MLRIPRRFVPPGWRQLITGPDPWLLAGIVAAIVGGAWLLSPAGAAGKLRELRADRAPDAAPNATGRAMGLRRVPRGAGGDPYPLSIDPLDTLGRGRGVPSHMSPRLVSHELAREYLRAPRPNYLPTRAQDLRNLALMPAILPPVPNANVALTASDVLDAQLGRRTVAP